MDTKYVVHNAYSDIAKQPTKPHCCSCSQKKISQTIGYTAEDLENVGEADLGLGCGNPVAFSSIREGDTVLDLGSGAGIDCFLASKKVGKSGKVLGVDFTQKMIDRAKENALKGGYTNIEFIHADIDVLPIRDSSVDIVISNCVINLAPDKAKVFREAYRVLKPGGKLFVSDIVLLHELTNEQRNNPGLVAGCVGGALLKSDYLAIASKVGFTVTVLNENPSISKEQYEGMPLESLLIRGDKA